MSTAAYNATNPFAIDNSRAAREPSYIITNQPKSLDWRQRGATPHPWKRVSEPVLAQACLGLNDILELVRV
jgi:mRNA interferase MazF